MLHTSNFAKRIDLKYFNHVQKKKKKEITVNKEGRWKLWELVNRFIV